MTDDVTAARSIRLAFVKGHGSGNDFATIDARGVALSDADWGAAARALSDRAGPVGGDGILLMTAAGETIGFRMFNPDGSEAETCLNGLRLVARMGFEAGGEQAAAVRLATSRAAVATAAPIAPGVVTVRETAGPATLDVTGWPLRGAGGPTIVEAAIAALPGGHLYTAVAMPNPHLIAFVPEIDEAALLAAWRVCEAAPDWLPNRANVSFVEVRDAATLFVRTAERGAGLTESCGSAMAAATHAACLTGRIGWDAPVTVLNRGGRVRATAGRDAMVTIEGNATFEWAGAATIDLDAGIARDLAVTARHEDERAAWSAMIAGMREPA